MSKNKTDFTFIDYLYMLVKHRWLIIINGLIFCLIAAVYSLLMPKTYTAHVTIMPPESQGASSIFSSMASATSNLPIPGGLGSLIGGSSGEVTSYLTLLKSRNMAVRTIERFNLLERYNSKNIDEALVSFYNNVDIELTEEGAVRIDTYASTEFLHPDSSEIESRQLAAEMANYMAAELDRINTKLRTKQARLTREFIGKRYEQNKEDLRQIEEEMQAFEEKHGVISIEDQVSAAIQSAAELKTEIILNEIQLKAMKSTLNPESPSVVQQEVRLKALRNSMQELKTGQNGEAGMQIFPPFDQAPELGIRFLRIKREMEVQNLIYEFLTQQFEQAKLQEARDTPTVQVVDEAVAPILREKPKRKLLVLFIGFISVIISAAYIFTVEYLEVLREENPERYERVVYVLRGVNIFKPLNN
ncbi:MAG: hypothetical protein K9N46_06150 [Candidatus Marinimicrobia bacterium]|nr:hypothetical protein [Candidatus Neomarinimicrobiota bacterium]MCF7828560.1 hypothetical protein [Candidatus Neomarinimicrobiota bacterium]MCF7880301.1 hypothetical protein [Candidatus Neomarinimicrobiota bacterium]